MYLAKPLPMISLFSGAGGLDLGLASAGFETRVAVEIDKWARQTLAANEGNLAGHPVPILDDITRYTPTEVLAAAGLDSGEAFLVAGGPPCGLMPWPGMR